MPEAKQSLTDRIIVKLTAFNQRLEERVWRNQELLEKMRAEDDLKKCMGYMKEVFVFKGGK